LRVLVVYDIGDNARREEFARRLQAAGLVRIQRSCFLGRGGLDRVRELLRLAERYVDPSRDVVHVFPLDEYSFRYSRYVGRPYGGGGPEGVEYAQP
jgi:CRISPR-associated protein Cas2